MIDNIYIIIVKFININNNKIITKNFLINLLK
jgi:hypothetical protein